MDGSFLRRAVFSLLLGFTAVAHAGPSDPIIREAGAIYLSDFTDKPLKLRVLQAAPAYFDFAGQRYVGTLRVPQIVEVQAIAPQAYRIRGNAQQGQILGWVDPRNLEAIPPAELETIRKADARRQQVDALIAKNQVAIGMTSAEVERSIGKPQKRAAHASAGQAVEETWSYVKYTYIPQNTNVIGPNGLVTVTTTYIKTPSGQLTVTFKNGIVDSLDQSEGSILNGNETTIVTPPVLVYW
jgi:hypothetical protein